MERWIANRFGMPGGIIPRELPDSQNMLVPTCENLFPYISCPAFMDQKSPSKLLSSPLLLAL